MIWGCFGLLCNVVFVVLDSCHVGFTTRVRLKSNTLCLLVKLIGLTNSNSHPCYIRLTKFSVLIELNFFLGAEHPQVVSVFENRVRKLHTTRSWNFLGLEHNDGVIHSSSLWKKARFGEDTIIGNLDTGTF